MCDVIEKFSMIHDCMIATLQRQLNLGLNAYCIHEMHNKFVIHNLNYLGEYFTVCFTKLLTNGFRSSFEIPEVRYKFGNFITYSGTRLTRTPKGHTIVSPYYPGVHIKRAVRENVRNTFYRYKYRSRQFYEKTLFNFLTVTATRS